MMGQPSFFDVAERYATLSAAGDTLERLKGVVDLELFRPVLDAALAPVRVNVVVALVS